MTENCYDYLLGMVSYSPVIGLPVAVICLNTIGLDAYLSQIELWCFGDWISELQERSL